jgi:hypothetical protein
VKLLVRRGVVAAAAAAVAAAVERHRAVTATALAVAAAMSARPMIQAARASPVAALARRARRCSARPPPDWWWHGRWCWPSPPIRHTWAVRLLGTCPGEVANVRAGLAQSHLSGWQLTGLFLAMFIPGLGEVGDTADISDTAISAAEDTEDVLPRDIASTFKGSAYSEVTTSEPTTLYRVYGGAAKEGYSGHPVEVKANYR